MQLLVMDAVMTKKDVCPSSQPIFTMSAQQNQLQNVTQAEFEVFMNKYKKDAVSPNGAKLVAIPCFF